MRVANKQKRCVSRGLNMMNKTINRSNWKDKDTATNYTIVICLFDEYSSIKSGWRDPNLFTWNLSLELSPKNNFTTILKCTSICQGMYSLCLWQCSSLLAVFHRERAHLLHGLSRGISAIMHSLTKSTMNSSRRSFGLKADGKVTCHFPDCCWASPPSGTDSGEIGIFFFHAYCLQGDLQLSSLL